MAIFFTQRNKAAYIIIIIIFVREAYFLNLAQDANEMLISVSNFITRL